MCSPYLIFILNFDEVDFKALELNMQWLEAFDRRPERQPIKVKMMEAKNRLRATHIRPNARLKDMKKLSLTEMRKS